MTGVSLDDISLQKKLLERRKEYMEPILSNLRHSMVEFIDKKELFDWVVERALINTVWPLDRNKRMQERFREVFLSLGQPGLPREQEGWILSVHTCVGLVSPSMRKDNEERVAKICKSLFTKDILSRGAEDAIFEGPRYTYFWQTLMIEEILGLIDRFHDPSDYEYDTYSDLVALHPFDPMKYDFLDPRHRTSEVYLGDSDDPQFYVRGDMLWNAIRVMDGVEIRWVGSIPEKDKPFSESLWTGTEIVGIKPSISFETTKQGRMLSVKNVNESFFVEIAIFSEEERRRSRTFSYVS